MIVEKKVFELPTFKTRNGATLKNVRIGWESYGTLNRDRSNAILVTHFFSATSHAAGRYTVADDLPGYWDPIIGPGKPIDTDKYFVFSSDTLVNLNARDPRVVTTGPARPTPTRANATASTSPSSPSTIPRRRAEGPGRQPRHRPPARRGRRPWAPWGLSMGGVLSRHVGRIMPVIGAAGAIRSSSWLAIVVGGGSS
jgi:homoserine O-acetyltransferase